MPKISINHNDSLEIVNNQLGVRRSPTSATPILVKSDGLYAEQHSSSGSGGFPDGYGSENGLKSGITSPVDNTPKSLRMVAPDITHRVFTCTDTRGTDIAIRACDLILPGDMYRVLDNGVYKYYIILRTTGTTVSESAFLVDVPENDSCN